MTEPLFSSTHPLLPPTSEDDRIAWLRLLRSRRVGIATFYRLLTEHGTAQAAIETLPHLARAAGVQDYHACSVQTAAAEHAAGRRLGARLICLGDASYPIALTDLPDAPPLMWVMGDASVLRRPCVALVGARNASSLGTRMTRALAQGLGQAGLTVVSGLARGVDTAAHLASLDSGTVAVMAGGVDAVYPSENIKLADDILKHGGVRVAECPMGLHPQARHFPARNRIISGLSQVVVVVEAAARSGSLITARAALDQGREVLAVPGHPFDARAGGCNMLIRDGARLVRSVDDVLEALQPMIAAAPCGTVVASTLGASHDVSRHTNAARGLADIAALHQQILDRLGPSPLAEDQLIRDLGASSQQVTPVLTDMELDGRILRQPGGLLARVS